MAIKNLLSSSPSSSMRGRARGGLEESTALCLPVPGPWALTCSLCALWSLWWVWVSGPLLPPKRLKKQMKQNYREWMETYLKGKPETQLEMLILEGMWAKLLFEQVLFPLHAPEWTGPQLEMVSFCSHGFGWVHPQGSSALLAHSHRQLHTHATMNKRLALLCVQPDQIHISGAEDKELWD